VLDAAHLREFSVDRLILIGQHFVHPAEESKSPDIEIPAVGDRPPDVSTVRDLLESALVVFR
jgi:hypothetical protein